MSPAGPAAEPAGGETVTPLTPSRPGQPSVLRFNPAERALHWLFSLDALVLTLTGLGLYLPPGRNPVVDRRELMRSVHIDAAIALPLLFIVVAGTWPGALARLWRDVEWFSAEDWRWLRRALVPARLRRGPLPDQGRFNAGQKLNTIAIAAATVGFVVTGALMDIGGHLPPSLADAADTWHVWLMLLCAPLVAGHLALALLIPATRPALRGIVGGRVSLDFAQRRHAAWVATLPADAAGGPPGRDD